MPTNLTAVAILSVKPISCGPRCDARGSSFSAKHPRLIFSDTRQAMQEIHKLRAQISRIVASTFPGIDAGFIPKLAPPNETQVRYLLLERLDLILTDLVPSHKQIKMLRQLLTAAFIDQVAIRKDVADKSSNTSYAKLASTRGVPYRAFGIEEDLFIHPTSSLFHGAPPEFIVYNEIHRTTKAWLKSEFRAQERLTLSPLSSLADLQPTPRSILHGFPYSAAPFARSANRSRRRGRRWQQKLRYRARPATRAASLSCPVSGLELASSSNPCR